MQNHIFFLPHFPRLLFLYFYKLQDPLLLAFLFHPLKNYNIAIDLRPDSGDAYSNLSSFLSSLRAKDYSAALADAYLIVLKHETCCRPSYLAHSIIVLLKQHPVIKKAIIEAEKENQQRQSFELCRQLARIPLLLKIMELCPIPDLELEALLKGLRKKLLFNHDAFTFDKDILSFQSSLALQCFTNEFVYGETEEETQKLKVLETNLREQAEKKAQNNNISDIKFIKGDAEKLPLEDNSVDYLSIAYGFRNIGHYDIALKEFYRVLKPEGTLGILEFSKPRVKIAGSIFNCYFHHVLPRVGSLFSRTDAYQYLPESVDFFPTRKSICDKIENAGFQKTSFLDLTFGISTIFSAYKDA